MNFQLVDCSHTNSGLPLSPLIIGEAASAYFHDFSAVAHGGCPFLCKFDVLLPQAPATLEIAYEGNSSKGALLAQSTLTTDPVQQHLSTVKLAGFALMKIRDDIPDSVPDRTQYLAHVLECLGTVLDLPVPVVDAPVRTENQLAQNYPNPFNPTTTIRFQMRDAGHATLRIFDAAGRLVATLVNGHVSAGEVREVTWEGRGDDGNRVSTGVYFYRLETPTFAQTRKMVLLK